MNGGDYKVRRATVDDLPQLLKLWEMERLSAADLEKRFTEFQLVEGENEQILAALGMQMADHQGRLHSEVFVPFDQAIPLRTALWNRFLSVARNHGLTRVWVADNLSFWEENGFQTPSTDALSRLPAALGNPQVDWRVLTLREENPLGINVEKQFEAYQMEERLKLEKLRQQSQVAKWVAAAILFVLLFGFGGYMLFFFLKKGKVRRQGEIER